jgi:hypothetical protein
MDYVILLHLRPSQIIATSWKDSYTPSTAKATFRARTGADEK